MESSIFSFVYNNSSISLVEEGQHLSTVFIPDAPRHDAGEIKIIETPFI